MTCKELQELLKNFPDNAKMMEGESGMSLEQDNFAITLEGEDEAWLTYLRGIHDIDDTEGVDLKTIDTTKVTHITLV